MPGKLPENAALAVLDALPLDITYIDESDIIRYYSDYRIFKRTPDILGTPVQNCHKPESQDEVNKVIDDLPAVAKTCRNTRLRKTGAGCACAISP